MRRHPDTPGGRDGSGGPGTLRGPDRSDAPAAQDLAWRPDVLGEGFESLSLDLGRDEEGPVSATLIRYRPTVTVQPQRTVLRSPWGWAGRWISAARQRRADAADRPGSGRVAAGSARRGGTVSGRTRPGPKGSGLAPGSGPRASGADDAPQAVLYVHGWSDYFFNAELAQRWSELGVAFYALDLRKYGRSLRDYQTPGFITDLREYDADLDAALNTLETDQRRLRNLAGHAEVAVHLMGHSTGGLTCVLWADRNPGRVRTLILNSPWLELQGSSVMRNATAPLIDPLARVRPKARLKLPELGFYWRTLSDQADGEWQLNEIWRPQFSFPITAGWLSAILAGHAKVARGLSIEVPILVLISSRSVISAKWHAEMKRTDSVLDVELVAERSLKLGARVTVNRIDGALHDVFLSAGPVRAQAHADLRDWARGYILPERA